MPGKPVDLPPESEEVAWFFGKILETDHAKDATFQKNFFKDWQKVLKEHPPVRLQLCCLISYVFLTLPLAARRHTHHLIR